MAAACLASFAILAGILASYGLDWYKNRKQNRRLTRKVEEDHNTKEPLAEQVA